MHFSVSSASATWRYSDGLTVARRWENKGRRRCSGTCGAASTNTRIISVTTPSTVVGVAFVPGRLDDEGWVLPENIAEPDCMCM